MGDLEQPALVQTAPPSGALTLREALHEARHDWLDLERGALGTVIDLTFRPAKVMRAYLYERRHDYVRPMRYLIFSVAAQVAASYAALNSEALQGQVAQVDAKAMQQANWLLENAAVLTLLLMPLIAGVLRLCFARHGMRYVDALVVASYTQAQLNLLGALLVLPIAWYGGVVAQGAVGLLAAVYVVFAWASFCRGRLWVRTLLALLAFVLAQALNSGIVYLVTRWI